MGEGRSTRDAIGSAPGIAAQGAKSIVDVFTGLPPEVMAVLVGAFGVNKLTGGVVVDVGGELLKGTLFSKGGNPANPLYVFSVNGGAAGGVPVAGGGGRGLVGGLIRGVAIAGAGSALTEASGRPGAGDHAGATGAGWPEHLEHPGHRPRPAMLG